jgi:polyphenol oxidase
MAPLAPAATFRRRAGLDVLTWPSLEGRGLDACVTTRAGGVSTGPYGSLNLGLHVGDEPAAVVENRRRAAAAVGCALDDLVFARQVHGREVAVVTAADRGSGARGEAGAVKADALVTTSPEVGLTIMVADCVPLVLVDPGARVLAVVHAGWRGTVARVAEAAVRAMTDLGADPGAVVAGIGPAIPADRYQVGDEVADAATASFAADPRGTDGILRPDGTGRWTFDLRAANHRVLTAAGVPAEAIEIAPVGTGGDSPFFSDRATRPCGRFAALARLRPGPAT